MFLFGRSIGTASMKETKVITHKPQGNWVWEEQKREKGQKREGNAAYKSEGHSFILEVIITILQM